MTLTTQELRALLRKILRQSRTSPIRQLAVYLCNRIRVAERLTINICIEAEQVAMFGGKITNYYTADSRCRKVG
ncbi:MAG: hypothetical protein E4H02_06465 [Lentisphaerales bacterium]|jgi:hypothetical protein|nr:MAG: hypothetical protein E4H02_06465 [Lentisphaerales bacterium]